MLDSLLKIISKQIYSFNVMQALRNCKIDQAQFKFFVVQRISIANNFERLLTCGVNAAIQLKDQDLALALQQNLADERGEDAEGNIHLTMAHHYWRQNYLAALHISDTTFADIPLLFETTQHLHALQNIEKQNDIFVISGALLASEIIIPQEFRSIRKSRDYLFPEKFVINPDDTVEEKEKKQQASLYLNDHIIHDAKSHYPMLLHALTKYENHEVAFSKIIEGIHLIKNARELFYQGIENVWNHVN